MPIFALSGTQIHQNMLQEFGIGQSAIYWRQTVAISLLVKMLRTLQPEQMGHAK